MRKSSFSRTLLYVLAGAVAASSWQFGWSQGQQSGRRARAEYDGPMNQVLLKDYVPSSNLVVPEHHPPKAKFPVVDVHAHPRAQASRDVAEWVKVMDQVGVQTVVLLTGATGANFDRLAELYLKPYPDRFMLFCGIARDLDQEASDFPEKVAAELERCYRVGARGVGEVTDKGRGFNSRSTVDPSVLKPRDKRLHVDDARSRR